MLHGRSTFQSKSSACNLFLSLIIKLPVELQFFCRRSSSEGPPGMDFGGLIRLVHSGVSTNFWGLGCPFYCGPSSFAALALSFICGFPLASFLAVWISFHIWISGRPAAHPAPGSPSPSAAALRLRQYVDARR